MIKNISRPAKSIIAIAGAVSMLALGGALPAFASGNTQEVITGAGSVSGGALTPGNFAPIDLTDASGSQTTDATFTLDSISDLTGTGAGWHLSLGMTTLTNGSHTLGPVTVKTAPQLTASATGSSSPTAINTAAAALASAHTQIDSSGGTGVTLLTAAAGDGMGSYSVSPLALTLTIPVTVYAGTYTSTATATLTSGPGL